MKKKLYTLLTMAIIGLAFTSCEDADIAYTLEGTWRGNMYVSSSYDGYTYDATSTEITFLRDPYTYSSGSGYWVDYYSGAPWDYVANHIDWTVSNGIIRIYFVEEGTSVDIRDYRLSDNRFIGTIYEGDHFVDFELYHVSSPNWSDYDYWGYDGWYDYYARTRADNDSTVSKAPAERPKRFIRQK